MERRISHQEGADAGPDRLGTAARPARRRAPARGFERRRKKPFSILFRIISRPFLFYRGSGLLTNGARRRILVKL
jgi:hypothetical protein